MGDKTGIEWTRSDDGSAGATWNPIVGCSIVSPGCTNCYAMRMAHRIEAMQGDSSHYAGTTRVVNGNPVWTGKVRLSPEKTITAPLRWKKPRRIFVNSMSDLFHEDVPDEWIDLVFAVMALAPRHQFQLLTKRSARMRTYFNGPYSNGEGVAARIADLTWTLAPKRLLLPEPPTIFEVPMGQRLPNGEPEFGWRRFLKGWPLPNVWLGVSAERQREAEERVPDLLETPAAIRFVSAEPLLGPINFRNIRGRLSWMKPEHDHFDALHPDLPARINQIITGGESGPGARPMHTDWARRIRDDCAVTDVAYFHKQNGAWKEGSDFKSDAKVVMNDGRVSDFSKSDLETLDRENPVPPTNPILMRLVGKKAAGRLLDGVEHNGMPTTN